MAVGHLYIRQTTGLTRKIMTDPENASDRLKKAQDRALKDEEQRQADVENRRIERLPYWMSPLTDYDVLDAGEPPHEYYITHKEEFDGRD